MILVTGGQTGVDQGFARAAYELWQQDSGIDVRIQGYRPAVNRPQTEAGPMPVWLSDRLDPLEFGGYHERTHSNVKLADAVLLVVPNRLRPGTTPGTALTLKYAKAYGRQIMVIGVDEPGAAGLVVDWLAHISPIFDHELKLMVAGPRESASPGIQARAFWLAGSILGRIPAHEAATHLSKVS